MHAPSQYKRYEEDGIEKKCAEPIGAFGMGSSIVMIFESPPVLFQVIICKELRKLFFFPSFYLSLSLSRDVEPSTIVDMASSIMIISLLFFFFFFLLLTSLIFVSFVFLSFFLIFDINLSLGTSWWTSTSR